MAADGWSLAGRAGMAALVTAGLVGVGGCLELSLVREVAFPEIVPGLAAEQPWIHLPVGAWVTEGGIAPRAIAACFDPACAPQAAVAVFVAEGPDAQRLDAVAARPERLVRSLSERRAPKGKAKPPPDTEARATPFRTGGYAGFAIRIARRDGGKSAAGVALTSRQGRRTRVILVVTSDEDAARRIARDVAAASG